MKIPTEAHYSTFFCETGHLMVSVNINANILKVDGKLDK